MVCVIPTAKGLQRGSAVGPERPVPAASSSDMSADVKARRLLVVYFRSLLDGAVSSGPAGSRFVRIVSMMGVEVPVHPSASWPPDVGVPLLNPICRINPIIWEHISLASWPGPSFDVSNLKCRDHRRISS